MHVRAYGTQRGGLAEHVEEAIEAALRDAGAPAPGTWSGAYRADGISFEHDEDARLSDQLFRARRVGRDGIAIRLTALRALCAPVGGLDAADAHAIAFYSRAADERPVVIVLDEGDEELPAFVVARALGGVMQGQEDVEVEEEEEGVGVGVGDGVELAVGDVEDSISLARVVADPPEVETVVTPEPEVMVDATSGRWRHYVAALDEARGPQTLASFERLFVQNYLPLADAVDHGFPEHSAVEAREHFRRTFARAYADALPTFALTGKRPRMVLDAFDVAAKMARAHGARTAQLLLVDGMRFDLAARIVARVAELCEGRATLADRITLFSTLPSSTPRQLESLARGVEALRSPESDRELEPLRGRTADTIRRMRLGSRDLYKLDVVETTLAAAGDGAIGVIDDVTEDTARSVAKHVRAQNAKTLLFLFGDHGFRFDGGAAKHGGASPEEVIVSGHAFLVGDLH